MSDGKFEWAIDLDSSDFQGKILSSIEKIKNLGDNLQKLATVGGVLGAAFLAVKTAFNLEMEAEQVKKIEQQFHALSKSVGIASDALENGLKRAAKGLVDDTELLQVANRGMVEFGSNASRLPEIMDLARKATAVFGGDLVQNFETLSRAIAFGQERTLRQYGITLDVTKAVQQYAAANGIAASSISEAGRQQAILNATLDQGDKKFKDVKEDADKLSVSLTRIGVFFKQSYEDLAKWFDRLAGSSIRSAVKDIADFLQVTRDLKTAQSGEGENKQIAQIKVLQHNISTLEKQIKDINDNPVRIMPSFTGGADTVENLAEQLPNMTMRLGEYRAELLKLQKDAPNAFAAASGKPETGGGGAKGGGIGAVDAEKEAQRKSQLEAELLNQDIQNTQTRIRLATEEQTVRDGIEQLKLMYAQQEQAQMDAIDAKVANGAMLWQEAEYQKSLIQEQSFLREQELLMQREQMEQQALDNRVRMNQNSATVVGDAWAQQVQRMNQQHASWAATTARVYGSVQNNAVNAFTAMGAGQKSASEAARGFIMGVLADEAIARGTIMFMSSIFPPNPIGLAAGGALIAFGGYLKSKAAGSSGISGGGLGAGGGGFGGGGFQSANDQTRLAQEERQNRNVQLIINGSVFDTEQTRTRIAELVRESDDATGFSVERIG